MSSALTWIADCFTLHAEASVTIPSTPSNTESASTKEEPAEDTDSGDKEEDEAEPEEEEAEEEEEEEEEAEDQKPAIVEKCEQTKACAPLKHHFDECQERVTSQSEEHSDHPENCVEEMFHLMHCVDQCMAPKLFAELK